MLYIIIIYIRDNNGFCRPGAIISMLLSAWSTAMLMFIGINVLLVFVLQVKYRGKLQYFYYDFSFIYGGISIVVPSYIMRHPCNQPRGAATCWWIPRGKRLVWLVMNFNHIFLKVLCKLWPYKVWRYIVGMQNLLFYWQYPLKSTNLLFYIALAFLLFIRPHCCCYNMLNNWTSAPLPRTADYPWQFLCNICHRAWKEENERHETTPTCYDSQGCASMRILPSR